MRSRPAWTAALIVAWTMFVVSFFLPAYRGGGLSSSVEHPLMGWEAAMWAFIVREPIPCISSATNAFFLATPFLLTARASHVVAPSTALLGAAAFVNTWWMFSDRSMLMIGYYLWMSSFFVMAGVCLCALLAQYRDEAAGVVRQS